MNDYLFNKRRCVYGALSFLLFIGCNVSAKQINPFSLPGFKGSYIATIADGDVYAQSYLGEPLTPYGDVRFQDQLTLMTNGRTKSVKSSSLLTTNSVVGTPEIMDISKDGRWAVVVETVGQRSKVSKTLKDLKGGSVVTLVDLRDPKRPRVSDSKILSFRPLSVAMDSTGSRLAVGGDKSGLGILEVIELKGKKFGLSKNFVLNKYTDFGKDQADFNPVSLVQWHPHKQLVAVHFFRQNRVGFYHVAAVKTQLRLRRWKNTVEVGPDPFVGRFSSSGDFYISANWGRNFTAKDIYDRLPKDSSSISLIQLSDGIANHAVIQSLKVPRSPEGLAFSPAGNTLAVISMQESLYSIGKENQYSNESAVSFFYLEEKVRKKLVPLGSKTFAGLLPEGGSFDKSGKYFLTTVFQNSKKNSNHGLIEVFGVPALTSKTVQHLGHIVAPHGTHHLLVR